MYLLNYTFCKNVIVFRPQPPLPVDGNRNQRGISANFDDTSGLPGDSNPALKDVGITPQLQSPKQTEEPKKKRTRKKKKTVHDSDQNPDYLNVE